MSDIMIFSNPEFGTVRTMEVDGQPWFVGKDVCVVFGDKNHNRSLGRVDSMDKKTISIIDSMGRTQYVTAINESGLYALLFAMQPQKAHNNGVSDEYPIEIQDRIDKLHHFKRWVTSEVLPSIRKHGAYMTPETVEAAILNPDIMIKLCTTLKEEQEKRKALELENANQKASIALMEPKVHYHDIVLQCKDLVPITIIAKDYGWSAVKMNRYLHERGVQYSRNKTWVLYQEYANKGYTGTKTHTYEDEQGEQHSKIQTFWTQAGRLFIYDLLKEDGILPLVEQMAG